MSLAAIYIRVSSEAQAEKASPDAQEAACRELAASRGLEVVAVYRDTTTYRVKGKLVQPSGSRADRPGLLAMLEAAQAGAFTTLIAWKEDRLYRGLKAAVMVLDAIRESRLEVLLVTEHFDAKMAPVKAWAASMELEAIRERMALGVQARLQKGMANTGQDRYGYRRDGESILVVEEEAAWVRQIFSWYLQRVPMMEMRRRLIEAGAPQKGSSIPRKVAWHRSSIQAILKAADEYASGIKRQSRAGVFYELPVEPIISRETAEAAKRIRQENKTLPVGNVKHDYLLRGKITCPCGRRWTARQNAYKRKGVRRKTATGVYSCPEPHAELRHPDCPKSIGSKLADDAAWEAVTKVLREPAILLAAAERQVEKLRQSVEMVEQERYRLATELANLADERQTIITWARKGRITESDMAEQLQAIALQESYLRREMAGLGTDALPDGWQDAVLATLADMAEGLLALQAAGADEELWELKRQVVAGLVARVNITQGKELEVVLRLPTGGAEGSLESVRNEMAETYSRTHEYAAFLDGLQVNLPVK